MAADPAGDGIERGKRLVRVDTDRGPGFLERFAGGLGRVARAPFGALRRRAPVKILAVPRDPVVGDRRAGQALLEGRIGTGAHGLGLDQLTFPATDLPAGFVDHLHAFEWLRDLSTAADRTQGAPIAEAITRRWLAAHAGEDTGPAWRPDVVGRRVLMWTAHAPLILSTPDADYRSQILETLARAGRRLDRGADRAPVGLPRIAAWSGAIAAALLLPDGDRRRAHGEDGLERALATGFSEDGGLVSRDPPALLDAIAILATLEAAYEVVRQSPPPGLRAALARAVPALLGVAHGDGGLASWQGGLPVSATRVRHVVEASGVRARPLRQARDWGYQRLAGGATVVSVDAAPPPVTRAGHAGCASTLAFEMSDGPDRIIVSCGGASGAADFIPPALAAALRTSAAHSTLVLADSNSTAINPDGTLGRGVAEVEIDRQETDGGSRLEASHDGYAKRYGLLHRRLLKLSADGRELLGEDVLLPSGRRAKGTGFALRFHLGPDVEVAPTADGMGALLRINGGPAWQMRVRGASLAIEDSLWIDPAGRPVPTYQLVASGEAPAGGTSISWLMRRAG